MQKLWYGLKPEYREEDEKRRRGIKRERDVQDIQDMHDSSPVIFSGMAAENPERYRAAEVMIAPSSIASGGFGLYSLRNFEVGDFLPVTYHGRVVSEAEYNELDDYLLKMANMSTSTGENIRPGERELNYLRQRWGFEVKFMERVYKHGNYWTTLPVRESKIELIDWDSIYDHFSDYSFEYFDDRGQNYIIYWPIYNYNGRAIVDERNVKNAGLMLNEPPNMDYYFNELTQDNTLAVANIKAEFNPALNKLGLKVISPVAAGEEFLLCYGPLYQRHGYFINTSPVVGCGQRAHLQSYLKPNFTYRKPLRDQLNAWWKKKLAKFPPNSREAFYSYLDQVNAKVQSLMTKAEERTEYVSGPRDYNTYNSEMIDLYVFEHLLSLQSLFQEAPPPSSKWRRERKARNDLVYVSSVRPTTIF